MSHKSPESQPENELIVRVEGEVDQRLLTAPKIYRRNDGSLIDPRNGSDPKDLRASLLIHSDGGSEKSGRALEKRLKESATRGTAAFIPDRAGSMGAILALSADQIYVRGKTNLHMHARMNVMSRDVQVVPVDPITGIRLSDPVNSRISYEFVAEEDLESHLEWAHDFIQRAPRRLRGDLSERLKRGKQFDDQAGFDIMGRELAMIDFGGDREVILCHGGIPEMRGHFNTRVGTAVAEKSSSEEFWKGVQKGTIRS